MSQEILDGRLTRRAAMRLAGMGSAAAVGGATVGWSFSPASAQARAFQATPEATPAAGPFEQAPLPYELSDLEPAISEATMELHYGTLHKAYVTALNALVEGQDDLADMSPEELIANLDAVNEDEVTNMQGVTRTRRAFVQFNAGGHYNHTMFWEIMGPDAGGDPTGDIAALIDDGYGDFATFQDEIRIAGIGNTGSGWVWVVLNESDGLSIVTTQKQDNPLMEGNGYPVMGLDVWEHAYLLQYGGARGDYITAWWDVVNWDAVNDRLAAAMSS